MKMHSLLMSATLATASLLLVLPGVAETATAHPCIVDEQVTDTGLGVALCQEAAFGGQLCAWVYSDSDGSGNFTHGNSTVPGDFAVGPCVVI